MVKWREPKTIEKLYKEVWLPIEGFEESYMISNYGRVKSLGRFRPFGPNQVFFPERIKTPKLRKAKSSSFYHIISLFKVIDGESKGHNFLASRLVVKHFLPETWNPELTVDHLDGDTTNDHVSNLEMVTIAENIRRSYRDSGPRGATVAEGGKFRSRIHIDGKEKELGLYATKEEAHKVFFDKYVEVYGVQPWEVDSDGVWVGTKYKTRDL